LISAPLPFCLAQSETAQESPANGPYVRIKWRQNFDGLVHREFLVKDARIVEVSEYSGVLIDGLGHVAVYIPDPLKLSSPQGEFTVSGPDGGDVAARLLGVDQRLSLAFLELAVPADVQAVLGQGIPGRVFRVLSWNGKGWDRTSYRLVESTTNDFGPVQTIRAFPTGSDTQRRNRQEKYRNRDQADRRSSFVLDEQDRLIGLGVSKSAVGLGRNIITFKVFPIDVVRESLHQLKERNGGLLESGWIGVYIDVADSGVRVTRVVPESPALQVGIRPGDTIVAFNAKPLVQVEDFIQAVKWSGPDKSVSLTVDREGSRKDYQVVLGKSPIFDKPLYEWALDIPPILNGPEQPVQNIRFRQVMSSQNPNMGLQVDPLTSQLAGFFKSPTGKGLLVEAVDSNSPGEQIGLKAGDVLIMIDDQVLKSSSDLVKLLQAYQEPVILSFVREGKVIKKKVLFP